MATAPGSDPSSASLDPDEVYRQLRRNADLPYGRARTVRAEELVRLADRAGDPWTVLVALQELIRAYNQGGERQKLLVPFARVLRMWDNQPSDFDEARIFRLHWHFKWATSGMIGDPRVPLATIEEWLGEMDTRYQLAGYGTRAVRQAEFEIAGHIGDRERARVAFDRWQASDRDEMSDCEACERRVAGSWRADECDDPGAMELWAPVLAGDLTCESEPHAVLSRSLLPLLRLGRPDQARANHLRGYRMARGVPDLRGSIGRHVEFCALSGNEARGLEIIAEHASWFDTDTIAEDQVDFLSGAAVLLRRLCGLGRGDTPVPGSAGRLWTVATLRSRVEGDLTDLVDRFDQRNGTDAVGHRLRATLERAPLVASLPLGLRASLPGTASTPVPAVPVPTAPVADGAGTHAAGADDAGADDAEGRVVGDGTAALVARARELTATGHPGAEAAWRRVADAGIGDGSGQGLDPVVEAELVDHRGRRAGSRDHREARRLLLDAANRFDALGKPARATCSRARAALAHALTAPGQAGWDDAAARAETAEAVAAIAGLAASGAAGPDEVMTVRLCRATALLAAAERLATQDGDRTDPAPEPADDPAAELHAALHTEVEEVVALAEARGNVLRLAGAQHVRARFLLLTGEPDQAESVLRGTLDSVGQADMPWLAGEPAALLAQIQLVRGDAAGAERTARVALATDVLDAGLRGHLALVLAEALARQERQEDAAASALDAAHWFDTAAETGPATHARILLAQAYRALGRAGEAAAILEETLPDIVAHHDELDVARVRQALASCLSDLDEHRSAAEQLLVAAEAAQGWPDQAPHAMLATDAARELSAAGMTAEATQAFERAARLWQELGAVGPYIRTLRATAWHVREQQDDLDRALDLMEQAAAVLADADTSTDTTVDTAASSTAEFDREFELAETFDQTARMLANAASDGAASDGDESDDPDVSEVDAGLAEHALRYALRAAEGFAGCGDVRWGDLIAARYLAARIEADLLGRPADAAKRLRAMIGECQRGDQADADRWADRCRSFLEQVEER